MTSPCRAVASHVLHSITYPFAVHAQLLSKVYRVIFFSFGLNQNWINYAFRAKIDLPIGNSDFRCMSSGYLSSIAWGFAMPTEECMIVHSGLKYFLQMHTSFEKQIAVIKIQKIQRIQNLWTKQTNGNLTTVFHLESRYIPESWCTSSTYSLKILNSETYNNNRRLLVYSRWKIKLCYKIWYFWLDQLLPT